MASRDPRPLLKKLIAERPPELAGQNRLLAVLELDLTALLRGYFPKEVARQLGADCAALARQCVERGELIRRVALTPSPYVPRQKEKR